MRKHILIGILFIAIVLVLGLVGRTVLVLVERGNDARVLNEAASSAHAFEMTRASELYEELSYTERKTDQRGRYSILAGLSSNTGGDYERGISILKEVIADENVSDQVKAEAIIALLNVYYTGQQRPLQLIFNDEGIYAAALGEESLESIRGLRQAVFNLYRTANEYYAYSFTHYALTLDPILDLFETELSETETDQALDEIRDLLDTGDLLYQSELASGMYEDTEDVSNTIREFLLLSLHLRLNAFEVLARHGADMPEDIDEEYAATLDTFARYDSSATRITESFMRLYYAAYLADVHGANRLTDIQEAIAPLMDGSGSYAPSNANVMWPYFERELSFPREQEGIEAARIRSIASVDPVFEAFLGGRNLLAE